MADDPNVQAGMKGFGVESTADFTREMRRWATEYHEAYRIALQKPRWADKTPQDVPNLELIHTMLGPDAQYVCLFRNPLDVFHSLYRRGWKFSLDRHEDPVISVALYVTEMTASLQQFARLHDVFVLHYEDLTAEPESTLRPMFDYLHEQWDPGVLEFYRYDHNWGVEDPVVQGSRSIMKNSGNWRSMRRSELDKAVEILRPVMQASRYEFPPESVT